MVQKRELMKIKMLGRKELKCEMQLINSNGLR